MADNSKQFDEFTTQNTALLNLLFWHQVFLEGVRLTMSRTFDKVLQQLYAEFKRFLMDVRYEKMDAFTKAELTSFIFRFRQAQMQIYSSYTAQLINALQAFVAEDVTAAKLIMERVTGQTFDEANAARQHNTLKGVAALAPGSTSLWASIASDPIPANGMTIDQMLQGFVNTSMNKVAQYIRMGYANGWTKDELLHTIYGSAANNWRDGYFAKMYQQNGTMVGTAVQHTSSVAQAAVTSTFLSSYTWVSVMDSHTTPVCASRNGKVYVYGIGPLPPANYGCRSKTVGNMAGVTELAIPTSFGSWLASQPQGLVEMLLGGDLADSLQGSAKRKVTPASLAKPLTLAQFSAKIKQLLGAIK
jgi:uncharacterized protein with gpF-like domain